jgi:cellulose biosynthesis protein BcsQ
VALRRRAAYRQASIVSKTAQETEPGTPAAEETIQLYNWVAQQLMLSPIEQYTKESV